VVADRLEAVDRDAIVNPALSLEGAYIRLRTGQSREARSALIRLQIILAARIEGRAGTEQGMRQPGAAAI
jgi:hypothetical protein